MKGLEWVIIVVLMAIFGLLGQWLENASKTRPRRPEPGRQPKRPDPAELDDYLREVLRGGREPEAKRPTQHPEPPTSGRPITPTRPATERVGRPRRAERPPQRPARPTRTADRQRHRPPQQPAVRQHERLVAAPERLQASVRESLIDAEARGRIQTDAVMAAPYAEEVTQGAVANEVFEVLAGTDPSRLLAAVLIADVLRAPVTQRQHMLPALRPLPTPLLPPPCVESWL